MATVLPFSPSSPMICPQRSSDTYIPVRSCSSAASIASGATVHHNRIRSFSTNSLSSVGSYLAPAFRRANDPASGNQSYSTSLVNLNLNETGRPLDRRSTITQTSRRASLTSILSRHAKSDHDASFASVDLQLVHVNKVKPLTSSCDSARTQVDPDKESNHSDDAEDDHSLRYTTADDLDSVPESNQKKPPFRRWVSRLRRKRRQYGQANPVSPCKERWVLDDFDNLKITPGRSPRSNHFRSDSQSSSFKFVTAMKSATATLASASVATISRRTTRWRRGQQYSSLISDREARPSIDSMHSILDEAAKQRSRKRREKLEELIRTEESYIADIKALSNAYSTILGRQGPAQKTIMDLLSLHDDMLGCLHGVIPFSEYDQTTAKASASAGTRTDHTRWHSVDVVPQRLTPKRNVLAAIRPGRRSLNVSRSSGDDQDPEMLRCSPQTVMAVTAAFGDRLSRFNIYEEYGANYDLIQREIEEAQRAISNWTDFDKAIEALSVHVNPTRTHEENRKKAMTVKDLLIKPIQRIPRYELLFGDLCKFTPVCDDPDAYSALNELVTQLHTACCRMNEAKENPLRARRLHTTWLVGERLNFSTQVPRSVYLKLLGDVSLCGCLYIAYRSKGCINGRYVVSILFETTLLLASADDDQPSYNVLAGLALANATIEETDNQKGLQCHTAPHSWKLVFEHSARMFEVIFTACSVIEAEVWRGRLVDGIEAQAQAVAEGKANAFELQSPLTLDMKSIGKAFGKPSSFVRRMSVHRTATVGPTTDLNQVIIKNTQAMKEMQDNSSQASIPIPRSQSMQSPSHIQTLQPRRVERQRLENILVDVWTKDLLPFPGMTRRSDPIRASANHVIRKFSMASITSNFSSSKRTPSYTSIASSRKEDMPPRDPMSRRQRYGKRSAYPGRPPLVNFHNAPDAFLPSDFELQDPCTKQKKSALRTFTLTMERPFSPFLGNESKASSLRRAQSVRDVGSGSGAPRPASVPPEIEFQCQKSSTPVYSVVQEGTKTLAPPKVMTKTATKDERPTKTPRKSKSRMLLRLFGQS